MNTTKPLLFTGRTTLMSYLTLEELAGPNAADLIKEDLIQYILPLHYTNSAEESYLFDFYSGKHPNILGRTKETQQNINNKLILNYAKSFSRDIVSYFLGKPIQYVQRKQEFSEDARKLKDALDSESKNLVDYEIAMNMSIVGVGYRGVFTDRTPTNQTHLLLKSLDPTKTFVVWSPDPSVRQLFCGTCYSTPPHPITQQSKTVFIIYTRTKKFVFEAPSMYGMDSYSGLELVEETNANLGGNLPIVEYSNSINKMGDWESELTIMDALDKLTSDSMNDIEQFVNSILLMQGFELSPEILETLQTEKILNISDVPPSSQVIVKYIAEQVDNQNVASLREFLETTMRTIVGVPDRKKRGGSGSDTGDAVFLRDGWQDIDLVAGAKEQFFIDADRDSLSSILYIMKTFSEISSSITANDIEIKFSRTKQANLQAKAQAYSTMVGAEAPIAPSDALEFADLTNNVNDVIIRAEKYQEEKMKESIIAQQVFMNNKVQAADSSSDAKSSNQQDSSKKDEDSNGGNSEGKEEGKKKENSSGNQKEQK